jgi:hypothetical protein
MVSRFVAELVAVRGDRHAQSADITTVSTTCLSTTGDVLCIRCRDLAARVQQGVTDLLRDAVRIEDVTRILSGPPSRF